MTTLLALTTGFPILDIFLMIVIIVLAVCLLVYGFRMLPIPEPYKSIILGVACISLAIWLLYVLIP